MFDTKHYLDEYRRSLKRLDTDAIARMSAIVFDTWLRGRTIFVCGNGGSAANASHFAADLTKLTASPRHPKRVKTVSLTESMAAISAIGNDLAYEEIFVEQLRPFLQPGDVVLGFSTSGSSRNVLRAIEYANECGAITLGITGRHGAQLANLALETLMVDSTSVQHIEDATMVAAHIMCLQVKQRIADHGVVVPAPLAGLSEALVAAQPN